MRAEEALARLREGNARFQAGEMRGCDVVARRAEVAARQPRRPRARLWRTPGSKRCSRGSCPRCAPTRGRPPWTRPRPGTPLPRQPTCARAPEGLEGVEVMPAIYDLGSGEVRFLG
ncbi:MAG: hypothetical protein IBX62_09115 [Coriobacteriia bacterium]|nr:hypothetical protein [Coriobacteriia bacterium]